MFKPFFNNLFHMIIRKRIVYNLSLSAEFHQVSKTQRFKLVRNRRFSDAKQYSQVADTHLALL